MDMPAHIAEQLYPEIGSSSPEVLSVNEEITQDLVDSLNHCVHAMDYALHSFCANQRPKIAGLKSLAKWMSGHLTIAEKKMMIVVVTGICHDNWADQLWDEFHYLKSKWGGCMDLLGDVQERIREEEAILEIALDDVESWCDQLCDWEQNEQTAVAAGEGYLEDVFELWEERNEWLVENGQEPVDGRW